MRRSGLLAALATAGALTGAGAAEAATYCVGAPAACPAGAVATDLDGALNGAYKATGHDTVLVGPGTYSAPADGFSYNGVSAQNTILVKGAGSDQTILVADAPTKGGEFSTFTVRSPGESAVEDLAVVAPGRKQASDETRALSLFGNVTARRVRVTDAAATLPATQGALVDGATLAHSVVHVAPTATAVRVEGGAPSAVLASELTGGTGVRSQFGGPVSVRETRIAAAKHGLANEAGDPFTVANVVVRLTQGASMGLYVRGDGDSSAHLAGSHLTVHGGGHPTTIAVAASAHAGDHASVALDNSIIHGAAYATSRYSDDPKGAATIALTSVNAQGKAQAVGAGSVTPKDVTSHTPGFADEATGDLRLVRSSPLLDTAADAAAVDPGASDAGLRTRTVGAKRDLGAHEHQHAAPTAKIDLPERVPAEQMVTLSAAGSDAGDPGDEIVAWEWDFGDRWPSTVGPFVDHAFFGQGRRTVRLTVTDRDGKTATAERELELDFRPVEGPGWEPREPQQKPRDAVAPAIGRLRRRGRSVRFSLSEPAAVTMRVQRRAGRRLRAVGRARRAAGRAGANRVALPRLKPGRYRVAVVATDAAGNRAVKRLAFRVM